MGAVLNKMRWKRKEPKHAPGEEECDEEHATYKPMDDWLDEFDDDEDDWLNIASEALKREISPDMDDEEKAGLKAELRELRQQAEQQRRDAEVLAKREEARRNFPRPTWLTTEDFVNVGVTGNAGVGKSSFINAVRNLRAIDAGAADVSPNETTMEASAYDFPDLADNCRLWDLPGAGTAKFPRDEYLKTMGLRYFDVVIIMAAARFTETEILIAEELRKYSVPFFLVRNKLDMDVQNNLDDKGIEEAATIDSIRNDIGIDPAFGKPFLISSKFAKRDMYDMEPLRKEVTVAICDARDMARDVLAEPKA